MKYLKSTNLILMSSYQTQKIMLSIHHYSLSQLAHSKRREDLTKTYNFFSQYTCIILQGYLNGSTKFKFSLSTFESKRDFIQNAIELYWHMKKRVNLYGTYIKNERSPPKTNYQVLTSRLPMLCVRWLKKKTRHRSSNIYLKQYTTSNVWQDSHVR